jgi:tetratricopeptide (TPR) repeat protein
MALDAYDYALAINDQNTFALFNKGNILSNLDRYEDAIPVYHEYLEIEPESFEAMTYLAECYEKSNDPLLARKYYHEAIDLAPEIADPWFGLGIIALNSGEVEESFIYLRKALRFDDENPEIWFFLGKAHYLKGEKKAALRCYREALKIDGYYYEVWIELGKIILSDGFTAKALPYLQQAYKVTGDVPGINYLLAAFSLLSSDYEKAFYHLSKAIENDKELFTEFKAIFPENIKNKKVRKLLEMNNLL